jgi:tetratricopeptide (TPR) repeat protein
MVKQNEPASPADLVLRAKELYTAGKLVRARKTFLQALALLESDPQAASSAQLAETYLHMVWVHFSLAQRLPRTRAAEKAQQLDEAIAWYERAIAVWDKGTDVSTLAGNMTNLSALCFRAGKLDLAVSWAKRGMDLAETMEDPTGEERLAAWNHYAGYCAAAGVNLEEAESVLKRGLSIYGQDKPNSSFLLDTLADVLEARAKQLRAKAEEVGTGKTCGISFQGNQRNNTDRRRSSSLAPAGCWFAFFRPLFRFGRILEVVV